MKKIKKINYQKHITGKVQRLKQIKEEMIKKQPKTIFEYNVILNSILGKHRVESRNRVNKILIKKLEENKKI